MFCKLVEYFYAGVVAMNYRAANLYFLKCILVCWHVCHTVLWGSCRRKSVGLFIFSKR